MRRRFSLISILLALLIAPRLFAQLTASVEVKVINVDVTVTDGSGHPVPELTRDDFVVFEDDQPQKITNFYVIDRAAARRNGPASALPDARQLRRRTLVLIDNNYLDKRDRDVALEKLETFINEVSESDDEWSIGAIGTQLDILQPYTNDHAAIRDGLAAARKRAVTSIGATDEDRDLLSDPFRRNRGGFDETARFEGRERTTRNARSVAYLTAALAESARVQSAAEGRKTIILITGGIEMNTSFTNFDRNSDREMRDVKTAIAKQIDTVIKEANAANVTVFIVNAARRGLSAPQHDVTNQAFGGVNDMAVAADSDISDADSTGVRIAAATGGLYVTSNYVRDALDKVNEVSSRYYSIGYTPSHGDDRQFHKISVRLNKPGLKVNHRRGYMDLSPEERLEDLLRLRVSILQPAREMPVTLELVPGETSDAAPAVAVTAAMPFKRVTTLKTDRGYVGRVHVYLSIFDRNGKNVGFHHLTQDVLIPQAQYDKAMADNFRYKMGIRLGKGDFTVAVTLRDDLSREIGTAVQNIRL